jgi:predicted CoA-binding protein
MTSENFSDSNIISDIIKNSRVIAVVGLSDKPDRPSFSVASYLKSKGYKIIPVNPGKDEILGEKVYPDLISIPEPVDVVDVFRRSETVDPIVDEAIKIKARAIWFQLGVVNIEAARKAAKAGLKVVMNRCLLVEHRSFQSG